MRHSFHKGFFLVIKLQSKQRMDASKIPNIKSLSPPQGNLCSVGNTPHPYNARQEFRIQTKQTRNPLDRSRRITEDKEPLSVSTHRKMLLGPTATQAPFPWLPQRTWKAKFEHP